MPFTGGNFGSLLFLCWRASGRADRKWCRLFNPRLCEKILFIHLRSCCVGVGSAHTCIVSPGKRRALHWHTAINLQKCRLIGISYKNVFLEKTPRNSIWLSVQGMSAGGWRKKFRLKNTWNQMDGWILRKGGIFSCTPRPFTPEEGKSGIQPQGIDGIILWF